MNKTTLKLLDKYRAKALSIARNVKDITQETEARHIAWMCSEIPKTDDPQKHNRWIGFIQGYFWTRGIFSIGEMRAHNIKCKL